ncbi:Ldh family oxidoreductase [Vallicoccus soli]|uniref:Ldh family oxidoreductase n=1 Tax=Vallicoccus soli TaxID=2339232 RepID=UPI001402E68B|nr:Ldh family oxidoreductase [Vallicoccus soli]
MTAGEALELVGGLLVDAGVPRERAAAVARVVVVAEAWGIASHGLQRVPTYVDRTLAGGHPPDAELVVVRDTGPLLTLDGGGGLGHWQVAHAVAEAVPRARRYGVALVAVGDSGHCGALGVYAADVAAAGLVGLVLSCGPAAMAPWGGARPLLSTSPVAGGLPTSGGHAVVDMALSTVARGTVARYAREGRPLPEGWALDAQGRPTADPAAALHGMLAPLGGAKGSALAFLVEALTAGLVGPSLSADVADFFDPAAHGRRQGIAHTVLVVDPAATDGRGDPAGARRRLDDLAARTVEAGGRVPGARRSRPDDLDPAAPLAVDGALWRELLARRGAAPAGRRR